MKKLYYRFSDNLIFVFIVLSGVLLIVLRDAVTEGIRNALTLSGEVLIPSLLPFMILSSFAVECSADRALRRVVAPVMNKLFRLPVECFSVILFGFFGGYPVGLSIAVRLYEKGLISKDDVRHLSAFCVNAGPAFIVTVAGGVVAGSRKAGVVMLLSTLISSIIIGISFSFFKERTAEITESQQRKTEPSTALVNAVKSSQENILSVCAWVMFFSAFLSVMKIFITNKTAFSVFSSVAEVTNGVKDAMKLAGPAGAAASIAFGGLSVMCQLMPMMKKCGVKAKFYLLFRIANAVITYIITKLLMCFVSVDVQVFSADVGLSGNNAPASAALLIMGAVFIYDLQKNGEVSSFRARQAFR